MVVESEYPLASAPHEPDRQGGAANIRSYGRYRLIMTANRYKITLAILSILVVFLGWMCFHLYKQIVSVGFFTYECEVTRRTVIEMKSDEDYAIHQLAFLKGCYTPQKYAPVLRQIVERDYYDTVHAVLLYLKSVTGKDPGDAPQVIEWWNEHHFESSPLSPPR